jgi:hypothetical protein
LSSPAVLHRKAAANFVRNLAIETKDCGAESSDSYDLFDRLVRYYDTKAGLVAVQTHTDYFCGAHDQKTGLRQTQ